MNVSIYTTAAINRAAWRDRHSGSPAACKTRERRERRFANSIAQNISKHTRGKVALSMYVMYLCDGSVHVHG